MCALMFGKLKTGAWSSIYYFIHLVSFKSLLHFRGHGGEFRVMKGNTLNRLPDYHKVAHIDKQLQSQIYWFENQKSPHFKNKGYSDELLSVGVKADKGREVLFETHVGFLTSLMY